MIGLFRVGLVKAFRADLELQVFHHFDDVVFAFEDFYIQVVERVVAFLVVHI